MRALGAVLFLVSCSCATAAPPPPPRPPPEVIVRTPPPGNFGIRCTPDDAEVFVDGVSHGPARDWAGPRRLAIAPGPHRVELRRPGYKTFRTEIAVGEKIEDIEVRLEKAPEGH